MPEKTIKQKIFDLLDENPLLLPQQLCKLAGLDYDYYANYVTGLRSTWKTIPSSGRGLKGSLPDSVHNWHGWIYVPSSINKELATATGWVQTHARNHYLLWKERGLGRLEWHPNTGRVKIWIRKPATLGKAFQLLANAFLRTALIFDIRLFETWAKMIRFKGAKYVFKTKERLPKMVIDLFVESNGIKIRTGDRSHPDSLEVEAWYPGWGEKSEAVMAKLHEVLKGIAEWRDRKPPVNPQDRYSG